MPAAIRLLLAVVGRLSLVVPLALVAPLAFLAPTAAHALEPKLAGHLAPRANLTGACADFPTSFDCGNGYPAPPGTTMLNVQGSLATTYAAFVMAADVDTAWGMASVTFGLSYANAVGIGVDILDWVVCGGGVATPEPGWPASGKHITITWPACPHPVINPADPFGEGWFPVAVLLVTAHQADLLSLYAYPGAATDFSTCPPAASGFTNGFAQFGFDWKIGYEPCTSNPFAHGCGVFFNCVCCLPNHQCRPVGEDFDPRACHNEGGEVLFEDDADCVNCAVPIAPTTWSSLKARVR